MHLRISSHKAGLVDGAPKKPSTHGTSSAGTRTGQALQSSGGEEIKFDPGADLFGPQATGALGVALEAEA